MFDNQNNNDDDGNHNDLHIIMLIVFIMCLVSFTLGRSSMVVFAAESDAPVEFAIPQLDSIESISWRYIDEESPNLGIEYYGGYMTPSDSFFSNIDFFMTAAATEPEPVPVSPPSYEDFEYWFFYGQYVYASRHPFFMDDGAIVSVDSASQLKMQFTRFIIGIYPDLTTLWAVSILPESIPKVKANHDIMTYGVNEFSIFKASDYSPKTAPAGYENIFRFGHYTFYSTKPLKFDIVSYNGNYYYLLGNDVPNSSDTTSIKYSYLNSDIEDAPMAQRTGSTSKWYYYHGIKFRYTSNTAAVQPLDTYYTKFISASNHTILNYDNSVYFDNYSPPIGWEPFKQQLLSGDYVGGEIPVEDSEIGILGKIFNLFNPFSKDNFLMILLVPSEDYFSDKLMSLYDNTKHKFEFIFHAAESIKIIFNSEFDTGGVWEGVDYGDRKLTVGGQRAIYWADVCPGDIRCKSSPAFHEPYGIVGYDHAIEFSLANNKLIDAKYISSFITKFKYYASAVMNFFFSIWLIRWGLGFFGKYTPFGSYSTSPFASQTGLFDDKPKGGR